VAGHVAVLDAMKAEHVRIDALLGAVDSCLAAAGQAGLAQTADGLAAALAAHMEHEEDQALPLVETFLGPAGWAAFAQEIRKTQGLRRTAEFFPWMLDDTPRAIRKRVLGLLPPPGSSTGPCGHPATPAPCAGIPRQPDPAQAQAMPERRPRRRDNYPKLPAKRNCRQFRTPAGGARWPRSRMRTGRCVVGRPQPAGSRAEPAAETTRRRAASVPGIN
jgi:hypothetical protein